MELLSRKEDFNLVESLVTQIVASFDEMKERRRRLSKTRRRSPRPMSRQSKPSCLDLKAYIEQIGKTDFASMPSKDDLKGIEDLVKEFKKPRGCRCCQ